MDQNDNPAARNPSVWKRPHQTAISEAGHDAYRLARHFADPTRCPQCGAVYRRGRWTWLREPLALAEETCPACRRIHDGYPAGELVLHDGGGPWRADILRVVEREAAVEQAEHPLNRVMAVREGADAVTVETTDVHTPKRIGEALARAFGGRFTIEYGEDETAVRARWQAEKAGGRHG